ncbi:hypothetical protein PRZ48_008409 [Zasmidium cellare]|uniref:Fungal lipase-type domain-containing protein n=1 Tax=Zasmidium cellare TaxID=395010 RepID=A0ABR0EFD6_ZASCE|nr:hypothetical protein PRZ48_008409 [Zasmidium cellare]
MHHFFALTLTLLLRLGLVFGSAQAPFLRGHSGGRNVSVALFTELEELARIVDITYCVGSTSFGISKPFSCLSRCADFPQFELVETWNTGVMLSDSCGYIALDHSKARIIVAFRGTYSIANTIADLSTVPQKYVPYPGAGKDPKEPPKSDVQPASEPKCLDCTVHWGFYRSWTNTRDKILENVQEQVSNHPDYELTLVGHSLGGAVAALAGLDFKARGWHPKITTFGEPRIGNLALVKYLDQRFNLEKKVPENDRLSEYRRVTHIDDPVPQLPLTEWGYAMHAGEIFISKPSLSPDLVDVQHCNGDFDPKCIAGQDTTVPSDPESSKQKRDLLASVQREIQDVVDEPSWGIPSRYKLWELLFAHRDYFWRLGLCVPGGDPLGGGSNYDQMREEFKTHIMTYNEAFFALLLASRLATAAYLPHLHQRIERDTIDDEPETVGTQVRILTEDFTPRFTYDPEPTYTYDPIPSFSYDPEPSFTYDPIPKFSYDPPAKRSDTSDASGVAILIDRDNGTLSHPSPNPTAVPSVFRTRPLTSLAITSTLDPNAPPPPDTTAKFSTLSKKPQSSGALLKSSTPPPPNPTAIPSAFRTKALSSLSITFTLDPNAPPPPNTTGASSAFSTKQKSSTKIASLDMNTPPPPNPTAVPSAFRTKPLTSLSITFTLDPNAAAPPGPTSKSSAFSTKLQSSTKTASLDTKTPPPPNPTAIPSAFKTKPLTSLKITSLLDPDSSTDVALSIALLMSTISAQNSLPTLIPISALPTLLSTIDILPTLTGTPDPNSPRPVPLVPTSINGGTAWVEQSYTGTNVNSAYVTKAPTTAFQFVSPTRLFTYTPQSELVHRTKEGSVWRSWTETLPTGMATGRVSKTRLYSQSALGFVEVGPGVGKTISSGGTTRPTYTASGEETRAQPTDEASATAKPSTHNSTITASRPSSSTSFSSSKQPSKTTTSPFTSDQVSEASLPATRTTSAESSTTPDQLIGKDKGKAKQWTGDLRCIYPTPGCDQK